VRTGADGPGAGLNNYSDKDTRNITIFAVAPVKSIVSTSEPSTTTPKVAIGEIVRYRMVVQIPRSTSPNFQLVDNIAAGMQYLNDNTTKVALVAHTGTNIISSTLGTSASVSSDTVASVTPTFVLPGASISGGTAPGVPPVFSLGNITNGETNAGTMEYVVIEFNALVSNIAPNVDATPLTDTFQVKVSGANSGPASNSQSVTVAEPKINTLTKTVDKPTGDAGDPLVYTLTFTNYTHLHEHRLSFRLRCGADGYARCERELYGGQRHGSDHRRWAMRYDGFDRHSDQCRQCDHRQCDMLAANR